MDEVSDRLELSSRASRNSRHFDTKGRISRVTVNSGRDDLGGKEAVRGKVDDVPSTV